VEKGGLGQATSKSVIAWADEMRLGLHGVIRNVWAKYGTKIVQKLQISYKWLYLNLAVDGVGGRLWWNWQPNMKKESVVAGLEAFSEAGVAVVVWDGAGSHKAAVVRAVEVGQIIQPGYAPELNPAERVFLEVRRKIEGRVYSSLAEKQAAAEEYLKELAADSEGIKRLAGWGWLKENLASLPNNTV